MHAVINPHCIDGGFAVIALVCVHICMQACVFVCVCNNTFLNLKMMCSAATKLLKQINSKTFLQQTF